MEYGDDEPIDLNAPAKFEDSDMEEENSNLQEVSEEIKKILESSLCRKSNPARIQVRSPYPLPKVVATRSLTLDIFLKQEVSIAVKTEDKELAKIQAFILDALAPLTSILEETGRDQESTRYSRLPRLRCS